MTMVDPSSPAHPAHNNHLISTGGKTATRIFDPPIEIPENIKKRLINICLTHLRERCGFLTSSGAVYEVDNVHESPHHNFFMDEDHVSRVIDEIYNVSGDFITAIWHTHPNDVVWPSPRDLAGWPRLELGWRYLIVTNNEVFEWEMS